MNFDQYSKEQLSATEAASERNVNHASGFAEALHRIIDEMDEVECEKVYERLRYNDIVGYKMAPKASKSSSDIEFLFSDENLSARP